MERVSRREFHHVALVFSAESVSSKDKVVNSVPISTTELIALHLGVKRVFDSTHSTRPHNTGLRGMTLLFMQSNLYDGLSGI
jgi:hypothetical protein